MGTGSLYKLLEATGFNPWYFTDVGRPPRILVGLVDEMNKKVILGNEYDVSLFVTLKDVLATQQATLLDKTWGVGGSQEIGTWHVSIGGQILTIEAETYMGLSLFGPADMVSQIASAVAEQAAVFQGTENGRTGKESNSAEAASISIDLRTNVK